MFYFHECSKIELEYYQISKELWCLVDLTLHNNYIIKNRIERPYFTGFVWWRVKFLKKTLTL